MKFVRNYLALALLCAVAVATASAQGGCVNSPENPTAVLAFVGFAAISARGLRAKLRSRK